MLRRDPEVDRRGREEVTPQPADLSSDPADDDSARNFAGVFALDGPSGTGKSTVARRLAQRLGAKYLDTGAMYRTATLAVLEAGAPVDEPDRVTNVVRAARIEVATDPAHPQTWLDGRRVDSETRSPQVTAVVSAVSANPSVRQVLLTQQRSLIGAGGIVVEGRDIGSV